MNEQQKELLDKFKTFWDKHPHMSFTDVVCYLAARGVGSVNNFYDPMCVEDKEMLIGLDSELTVP